MSEKLCIQMSLGIYSDITELQFDAIVQRSSSNNPQIRLKYAVPLPDHRYGTRNLKMIESSQVFKRKLKTYLFIYNYWSDHLNAI